MNTYKQYRKIEPPYFSFSEYIISPGFILFATMIVSYFSLYYMGFTFTCFLYCVVSIFINLFYHGLKNFSPNGNNHSTSSSSRIPSFIALLSLAPSYFFILFILFFTNIGTYLIVTYQETNVFYATIFCIWLCLILGLPIIYYTFKFATYYHKVYSQALQFTNVRVAINYDPEFLIKIDEVHFIYSIKKRIAKYSFKEDRELDVVKSLESLTIQKRNQILFSPAFSELLKIPVDTNLLKISYYSISEDTFYKDEIAFPFDQLHFEENKYPLNKSKILRGKKTDPLAIHFFEKGKIKIFSGTQLVVEKTLKKNIEKIKNKAKYIDALHFSDNKDPFPALLFEPETATRIKTRQKIRETLYNWTLNLDLSHNHLICVYDCNNNKSLRKGFTDLKIKQPILQNSLPKEILFYSDAFDRTKWLEIAIDTEKLYEIIVQNTAATFDIFLTANIEDATIAFKLKIEDQFVSFDYWEKNINDKSLLEIQNKIIQKQESKHKKDLWNEINALMQNKEYIKAKEKCEKSIRENPKDGMLYFYEARLLFYMEGKDACYAKKDYFMTKTKDDLFAFAHMHNNFGCMLDEDLKYDKALTYFEKANELVPEMAIYVANKAEIHYKLKNKKEAISFAKEAIEKGDTSHIVKEIIENNGKL